jgi:hypothetical protein
MREKNASSLMKGYSGESRFFFGAELGQHLRELIEGAIKIRIATAWISDSQILSLLLGRAQQGLETDVEKS